MDIESLNDPAILLGNGLNLLAGGSPSGGGPYASWEDILSRLASSALVNNAIDIRALSNGSQVTLPELYSVLALREDLANSPLETLLEELLETRMEDRALPSRIRSTVARVKSADMKYKHLIAELMRGWRPREGYHDAFVDFASSFRGRGMPVLTTNYDMLLEDSKSGSCEYRLFDPQRSGGTRYLDKQYYARAEAMRRGGSDRFAIWHIHGSVERPGTIKVSHDDYANMLAHYKELLSAGETPRWMQEFFNCDLVILGLGLGPQEFPLRWLLLERMKRIGRDGSGLRTIYMSTKPKNERLSAQRDFFFKSIGIEVDSSSDGYGMLYRQFGVSA